MMRGRSVWDYSTQMEETYRPKYPEQRNAFLNLNPAGTKTTVLRFINEDDETLLLAGSSKFSLLSFSLARVMRDRLSTGDGVVRIYRDYAHPSRTQLVTSWRALTNLLDCSHGGSGMVAEWIQSRGILACSGDVRYIRVWDAAREMCMAVRELARYRWRQADGFGPGRSCQRNRTVRSPQSPVISWPGICWSHRSGMVH